MLRMPSAMPRPYDITTTMPKTSETDITPSSLMANGLQRADGRNRNRRRRDERRRQKSQAHLLSK